MSEQFVQAARVLDAGAFDDEKSSAPAVFTRVAMAKKSTVADAGLQAFFAAVTTGSKPLKRRAWLWRLCVTMPAIRRKPASTRNCKYLLNGLLI